MSTLFGVPVDAVYHLVFALTNVLTPVLGGLAAVAGIIVITLAVRLLVSPLTFRALRGQAAQTRLAPSGTVVWRDVGSPGVRPARVHPSVAPQ